MYMPTNATGWSSLINGDLIGASWTLYDTTFGHGWVLFLLFMLFQVMLWFKTRSIIMLFVTGLIFVGIYAAGGHNMLSDQTMWMMYLVLVFEGAASAYEWWWKSPNG